MKSSGKRFWRQWALGLMLLCVTGSVLGIEKADLKEEIASRIQQFAEPYAHIRSIQVVSLTEAKRTVRIEVNEALEDIPFRPHNVQALYDTLRPLFPDARHLVVLTHGIPIEQLIPEYAKEGNGDKKRRFARKIERPGLITPLSRPYTVEKGLQDRYITVWSSHGLYYAQKGQRWEWQRARMFGTVEDLYTHSYVVPFLMPMLENAGAQVFLPRERDTQIEEVIVDRERASGHAHYEDLQGDKPWRDGGSAGYAFPQHALKNGENPFTQGSFRQTLTVKGGKESVARWVPRITQPGDYAVYVAYRSLPNSTEQARYTIHHAGITTSVAVNQTMGGGTWIYLGHYYFRGDADEAVSLTNRSEKAGKVITADAVRFGGGIGSVARAPMDDSEWEAETSGFPRFTEAARYWLQWAGMPDSVYSSTAFADDYRDDIFARPRWVNWLREEAHIPVDLSFAFHTDAGITPDDSIVGTLGIYYTEANGSRYSNGQSRWVARDLTDRIQSQIVSDIQATFHPEWSRRGMWNQSYIEARVPEVPTMLLELLSHQNFADMCYGLDPKFRFVVSRAIYKGMLRHIAAQNRQEAVVQPLPPQAFSVTFEGEDQVCLSWQPMPDPLEPSAMPKAYVLYTAKGEDDFDNGRFVQGEQLTLPIERGVIYRYKVAAWNEGGVSFPSEVLSAYRAEQERSTQPILIVNAFDRVDGPMAMTQSSDSLAGFLYTQDGGVPYLYDFAFIGAQNEFRRSAEWISNDRNGHGDSFNDYAGKVIAGNQFDYPYVHGQALAQAGYSYTSCGAKALLSGRVQTDAYAMMDVIFGKQRLTETDTLLWQKVAAFTKAEKALLVSGSRWLSDIDCCDPLSRIARGVLPVKLASSQAARTGCVSGYPMKGRTPLGAFAFQMQPNADCYAVEAVDGLLPLRDDAVPFLRYTENRIVAGVRSAHTCALGFPLEALRTAEERNRLAQAILQAILP